LSIVLFRTGALYCGRIVTVSIFIRLAGHRKNDRSDMKTAQRIHEKISQLSFYNDGNKISMMIRVGVILGRADSLDCPARKVNVDTTVIILSPVFGKTI
jgi:hypothetical protein